MLQEAFADLDSSPLETNSASTKLELLGEPATSGMVDGAFATFATAPVADNDPTEDEDVTGLDQAFSLPSVIPGLRRNSSRIQHGRGGEADGKAALRHPVAAGRHLRNQLRDLDGPQAVKKDFLTKDLLHRPADSQGTDQSDPDDGPDDKFRKPRAMKRVFALLNTFFGFGL